jgi:hypothetical protein
VARGERTHRRHCPHADCVAPQFCPQRLLVRVDHREARHAAGPATHTRAHRHSASGLGARNGHATHGRGAHRTGTHGATVRTMMMSSHFRGAHVAAPPAGLLDVPALDCSPSPRAAFADPLPPGPARDCSSSTLPFIATSPCVPVPTCVPIVPLPVPARARLARARENIRAVHGSAPSFRLVLSHTTALRCRRPLSVALKKNKKSNRFRNARARTRVANGVGWPGGST